MYPLEVQADLKVEQVDIKLDLMMDLVHMDVDLVVGQEDVQTD